MYQRGIRGAITVEQDSVETIEQATVELFSEIVSQNHIEFEKISHIIFTMTNDLKSAYPAKFVREHFDIKDVPLMCMAELAIENSLKKCIRTLVVINTEKSQKEIKHVYLKDASFLRPDLKK